jgi:plasmid stabilization system protein ParE
MSGYAFHLDAFADLDEIWEYIAQNNIDAARRPDNDEQRAVEAEPRTLQLVVESILGLHHMHS